MLLLGLSYLEVVVGLSGVEVKIPVHGVIVRESCWSLVLAGRHWALDWGWGHLLKPSYALIHFPESIKGFAL